MKVLIACESSGQLRRRFHDAGHDVTSCDLLPCDDPEHPSAANHYQGDVFDMLEQEWDLIILHPPCTYLSVSSNAHYAKGKPKHHLRKQAIEWTLKLYFKALKVCKRVALENPISVIFPYLDLATVQYVQPHDYGDDASKKTGFATHGLPKLTPTKRVPGRLVEWPKGSGKIVERWSNQTDSGQNKLPPSPTRGKERSKTYDGIADAIVDQWGKLS